jgi:hypothetical protein
MKSFIYIISNERGPIKIGISNNPQARLIGLRTGSADALTLTHIFKPSGSAKKLEKQVHMMLAKAHISGEWFNATVDDAVIAVERAAIAASQTITPVGLRPTGKAMRRNSFSGATPMVGFRLATNLRDFLEQEADKENRSLSNMIMHALLEWMQERGYSVTDHLSHPR